MHDILRARLLLAFAVAATVTSCKKDDPEPTGVVKDTCDAYEFQGMTYDCTTLDPCAPDAQVAYIACCDCDPTDAVACAAPDTAECTGTTTNPTEPADSCMGCHNGSEQNDYSGTGISNPHPFGAAPYIRCTGCHGGNGQGVGKEASHTPPPPEIGDRLFQTNNPEAYFNRRTLTGIDKYPDYVVDGVTYSPIDYLQFINPGDLRVVGDDRSCGMGGCHGGEHVEWVTRYPIATETGFYSGTNYTNGISNAIPEHEGLFQDTAADYAFREVEDPSWVYDPDQVGRVGKLIEYPEHGVYGDTSGFYNNPIYDSTFLPNYVYTAAEDPQKTNRIKDNSPLEHILEEAVAFQCGDCHLGSAGANNRYGDFRSSGCTACHMEYSFDGRSKSSDPNVNKLEPANPDAIAAPERPHIMDHQIRNVAKELPDGTFLRGINDKVCVGCHQGSNRTVLQYWGIRLDQNQDLTNGFQYPANPVTFQDATGDTRLYDPAVGNTTFNGRVAAQHIVFEDYDGDARDDTPEDVHYEAGLGCIDCHGSRDVHGGTSGDPTSGWIMSRESQALEIECTSCHGGVDDYAATTTCETYDGQTATCPTDRAGNPLRNVQIDANGDYWLTSRVTGARHYVPQTYDTIVNNAKVHPITGNTIYSPLASYAMGIADGNPSNGTGPIQADPTKYSQGFTHTDDMECVGCHASWTNSCVGCHLEVTYDDDPQDYFFSNTTGERIATPVTRADFTYQSPVLFTMGIGTRNQITNSMPGMKMFLRYVDYNGVTSQVFAFSDRNGNGNNPDQGGRGAFPALAHNKIMAHSVRGRVTNSQEGPRYCVTCHLTDNSITQFGAGYAQFRVDIENRNYANLDYNLLQTHIGLNTGNQLDSPYFVHQVAGLGTGLFQFDANGCPNNPLDPNDNRQFCQNLSPQDRFDPNNTVYDLDKIVELAGTSNASSNHPLLDNGFSPMRTGSLDPGMAGPYGALLLQKLTDPNTGLILDGWIDANGAAQGTAPDFIQ